MAVIEVSHLAKAFGRTLAVVDVSFSAGAGEIVGLLGPNGAGKTTTIRLLLDIFRPDAGSVAVFGGPMTEEKKSRIGYLPEDRGLYQDASLERCLLYLATLKGVPEIEARVRLDDHLERFALGAHRKKKVKELSRGMQQKAQVISAILHRPQLVIVDEPFAALDPLNTQLVKQVLGELRDGGATILMSTHQMHQAEELCDRIVLINAGRDVLQGSLSEVRQSYSGHAVVVRVAGELPEIPGVLGTTEQNGDSRLSLAEDTSPQDVLRALVAAGEVVEKFELALASLEEVFIGVVGGGD